MYLDARLSRPVVAWRPRMPSKSTRQVIASQPTILLPGSGKAYNDNAAAACSEWLARHNEQETLAKSWQRLESYLIREREWFQLTKRERALLPEATQLNEISNSLDELYALNQSLLNTLSTIGAATSYGLACKLSVALALIHPEENKEVHKLLLSVLRDVKTTALTIKE
tara:strand:- start:351 stop:857 length:507 start_codon:yes stop_codon:yes gene_type:complete